MKLTTILIILCLLIAGCTLEEICIEGDNLTYDGQSANGKIRISSCKEDEPNKTKINISELPKFNGRG